MLCTSLLRRFLVYAEAQEKDGPCGTIGGACVWKFANLDLTADYALMKFMVAAQGVNLGMMTPAAEMRGGGRKLRIRHSL